MDLLRPSSSPTPTPAWKDEDLVEHCLKGNEQAWAAMLEKYKGLVYYASIKYQMDPQDAKDLFQEVWLDLYSELGNLRKPGALGDWLIAVTWHKCFRWEGKRLQAAESQSASDTLFPEWKQQAQRQQILRETIAQLSPCCRRMFDLLFQQDTPITCAEATRQLELSEASLGFHCGNCLDNLRTILEQKGF
jgi:RNA polymerase sigma factor (sigma-70 family)